MTTKGKLSSLRYDYALIKQVSVKLRESSLDIYTYVSLHTFAFASFCSNRLLGHGSYKLVPFRKLVGRDVINWWWKAFSLLCKQFCGPSNIPKIFIKFFRIGSIESKLVLTFTQIKQPFDRFISNFAEF